jgi:hypothetical protein
VKNPYSPFRFPVPPGPESIGGLVPGVLNSVHGGIVSDIVFSFFLFLAQSFFYAAD